ncbi:hypothetical protein ASG38_15150 [Flavobacterium sp. Leaf359]|uniref:hypothetical protein n=1 Tax=Flavobacterium sp. Leaf359 TaxID=1736351 RepID=UPI0006FEEA0A|nr:hypothetical protein [Flavobacterium sp. Leaf359]KQS45944.1 hypothetical protein ASG38_15150 [Flavobacterium sp. Leaf359]
MKKIFILFSLLAFNLCYSQAIEYYYPNGKFIDKGISVNNLVKKYFPDVNLFHNPSLEGSTDAHANKEGVYSVYYKILSNKPLFVLAYNKHTQKQIDDAIAAFDLENYYKNWRFDYDIKNSVREKKLTDINLYEALGKPDNINTTSNGNLTITTMSYKYPDVVFVLKNGIVTSYSLNQ